jgi:2-phosphosulfolactate phosphatase
MHIHIRHYAAGAAEATDFAVIIDVFRAFSMACYAFSRGAARIIAAREVETARGLKQSNPGALLMGERHARKLPGFDFGNSPTEIQDADLSDRLIVHTTHSGTRALTAAAHADPVITGSFVNCGAIVHYIQQTAPKEVSLVCSGFEGRESALEDMLCAEYIRGCLRGEPTKSFDHIREELKTAETAKRFFDPADTSSPATDFELCLALDRFPFVIRRAKTAMDWCELERVDL